MADDDATLDPQQESEPQEEAVEEELSEEEAEEAKLKEAVEVESEDVGNLRKKLTITVKREHVDERMSEQFAELKREAQVDGFRKGRAPLRLIEKRFGRDVSDQMVGTLVGNAMLAALEKADLENRTIGEPQIWVKVPEERSEDGKRSTVLVDKLVELDQALEYLNLPTDDALTFTCEVELKPEFDLPELEGISVERPSVEITDEMVTEEVDRVRASRGQYVPVADGPVEADDLLVVDYKAAVGDETLAEEANRAMAARDQRLEDISVEGLGDALQGKKVGDEVTIEATVPDEHEKTEIRGKKASFHFTIQDIKRFTRPDLDQEFLTSLGMENEEELRETIRAELEVRRNQMVKDRMRDQVRKHLLENTSMDLPEGLSQRQTDRLVSRRMIDLYRMGMPQPEIDKRIDELKASAADEAVEELRFFFIMEKIAEELEVSVTEEEINSVIGSIAARSGQRFDRVRDQLGRGGLENLYIRLRDDKILDRLIENAQVTDTKDDSE